MKRILIFILMSLLIVSLVSCGGNKPSQSSKPTEPSSAAEQKKEDPPKEESKINYDNFKQIQIGESKNDVFALLGDGTESSSTEANNVKTVSYAWKNNSLGNISVSFQNDKLMSKTQYGLSKDKIDVSLDQFNSIQNGCSYEDVQKVLGDGILVSQTEISQHQSTMYDYYSKTGGTANFSFMDNALSMKNQNGLK